MYYYNGAQRYEQFLQVGQLYRALILLGLALLSSEHLCVFGLHGAIYLFKQFLLTSFSLPFSWTWWDLPLTWLTNHHPSVLWHVTRKIVSEMTYNVSSGTLNTTVPYHSIDDWCLSVWMCVIKLLSKSLLLQFFSVSHESWHTRFMCQYAKTVELIFDIFLHLDPVYVTAAAELSI